MRKAAGTVGYIIFVTVAVSTVVVFCGLIIGIILSIPTGPWCNIITPTGGTVRELCPPGFNAEDQLRWDNTTHTYKKVG